MVRDSVARDLVGLGACAEMCGLGTHEMLLGVSPCERHDRLFAVYKMTAGEAQAALRARIVADIRRALDHGVTRHAADLLVVLRRCLAASGPDVRKRAAPCLRRARGKVAQRRGDPAGAVARREAPGRASSKAWSKACDVLSLDAFRTARAGRPTVPCRQQ